MTKTKSQTKQSGTGDIGLALQSADAFRALSRPFLDFVGTDMAICHDRALNNLGPMIASATSLSLSIELYLKALRLLLGLKATYTHDLLALFDGLPQATKDSIVKAYNAIPVQPIGVAASLILGVVIGELREIPPYQAPEQPPDNSLPAVLRRSKDAFQTWRYMHERGEHGRTIEFAYEFYNLGRVADAVRPHVAPLVKVKISGLKE